MRFFIAFCLVGAIPLLGFAQNEGAVAQQLTLAQVQEDWSILSTSLQQNHPRLDLYTPQAAWTAAGKEVERQLEAGMTPIELYRVLTPLLPLIGNNHTNILPPKSFIQHIGTEAKRFPFSLHFYNDTLYVLEDASQEYVIREGRPLLSIDGVPTQTIFDHFLANISTDGFNTTQPALRASRGFSRHMAYHYPFAEAYEVRYLDSLGTVRQTTIQALTGPEIAVNRARRARRSGPSAAEYAFRVSEGVGILRVKTFTPSAAKAYRKFLRETFQEIAAARLSKLVIDLRGNMGGYPEASSYLLSYLIDAPIRPNKTEYAITDAIHNAAYFVEDGFLKHFQRQKLVEQAGRYLVKGAAEATLDPQAAAYDRELYVLIDANSSSTTGQLLGLIKTHTDATFLGEESGGNPVGVVANDILTLVLPHSGIEVKLPVIYSEMNVDFANTGHGIIPDYPIIPTTADLLRGEDVVLQRALDWIAGRR